MKNSGDNDRSQLAADELRSDARRRAFAGRRRLSAHFAELWLRYDKLFPRKKHPVINLIWFEILRRCSSLVASLATARRAEARENKVEAVEINGLRPEAPTSIPKTGMTALKELEEISKLLEVVGVEVTAQERVAIVEQAIEWRPHIVAKAMLDKTKRSLRGRKASQRPKALQALEFRVLNPSGHTWPDLAHQFYGCNHERRTSSGKIALGCEGCGELLRRELIHLKKLLTKLGIKPEVYLPAKN